MKTLKPTLAHLAYLAEAGTAVRDFADRERAIIARVEKAIADGERDLMALRAEAHAAVRKEWTPAEEAEAREIMAAEIAAGR
mgnify:CR=1 FL=1